MIKPLKIILFVSITSVSILGCSAINNFGEALTKASSQVTPKREIPRKSVKVVQKKTTFKPKPHLPISNDCSYIIRDLSNPYSSTVWCMPKAHNTRSRYLR